MTSRVHTAPVVGDYLTDGTRLVSILGVDRDGRYEAEDAATNAVVAIPVEQLSRWRIVREAPVG